MNKNLSFEQGLKNLEDIVSKLENEEVSLEEAINYFKEGEELIKLLRKKLEKAELEIKKITKDENGNFQLDLLE